MQNWLIETTALDELKAAKASGWQPTSEMVAAFATSAQADSPRILDVDVDGAVANIQVLGVLTEKPSLYASIFGGGNTSYAEIIDAVALAEADERVKTIRLNINSPGGTIAGMFDAMDIIAAAEKPVEAVVDGLGASAAYGLSSQADKIVAKNDTTRIGSVGVAATFYVWDDEVDITSTNAPKKRPDLKTEEGRAVIRAQLDDIAEKFAERIASGRTNADNNLQLSTDDVNADFGQGSMLLAEDALKSGMIDAIMQKPVLKVVTKPTEPAPSGKENTAEVNAMDLKELKASHPELAEQLVAEGVKLERSRVSAHLTMGERTKSMDFAATCIREGKSLQDDEVTAEYFTAGLNAQNVSDRGGDNTDAGDQPIKAEDIDQKAKHDEDFANALSKELGIPLAEGK